MIALVKAFDAGNLAEARKWHRKLFPLCRDMLGLATNPIPIKAAMKLLGRDTGELRLPMTPLDAPQKAELRKTLADYGLLRRRAVARRQRSGRAGRNWRPSNSTWSRLFEPRRFESRRDSATVGFWNCRTAGVPVFYAKTPVGFDRVQRAVSRRTVGVSFLRPVQNSRRLRRRRRCIGTPKLACRVGDPTPG